MSGFSSPPSVSQPLQNGHHVTSQSINSRAGNEMSGWKKAENPARPKTGSTKFPPLSSSLKREASLDLHPKRGRDIGRGLQRSGTSLQLPHSARQDLQGINSGMSGTGVLFMNTGVQFEGRARSSQLMMDSVEREFRGLYKNGIEERRLHKAMVGLDRQSFAHVLDNRNKQLQVYRQLLNTNKRSPTAEQWLLMRQSRTANLQQRERDEIARRYRRRARQFRAPPHLQEMVGKIRSFAQMESPLLHGGDERRYIPIGDDELDETVDDLASLSISRRRHTLPSEAVLDNAQETISQLQRALRQGRRLTIGEITSLANQPEVKGENSDLTFAQSCQELDENRAKSSLK